MAQRFIEGIGYHERRSQLVFHKFEKRKPLGLIEAKFNIQQEKPELSIVIEPFDPVSYGGEKMCHSANVKSSASPSYDRPLKRNMSAPPQFRKMREQRELFMAKLNGVDHDRPSTTIPTQQHAKYRRNIKLSQRRALTDEAIYRFQMDRNSRVQSSQDGVKRFTRLIKEQFDPTSRAYVKEGVYARGKSTGFNSAQEKRLQQWFSFEGGAPGAIQAFAGDVTKNATNSEQEYTIEASVGKHVAAVLVKGDPIRVYKNGKNLKSALSSDLYERCDKVIEMTKTYRTNDKSALSKCIIPLCMEDAVNTYKVLPSSLEKPLSEYEDLNETHPVVFNKKMEQKPYEHPDVCLDGYQMKKLLKKMKGIGGSERPMTALSISKQDNAEDFQPITYEDVLQMKAPEASSKMPSKCHTPVPSPEYNYYKSVEKKIRPKSKRKPFTLLLNPDPEPLRVKTPVVPEDVKSHIQRQFSMPSYSVLADTTDEETGENKVIVMERSVDTNMRTCNPVRPPQYTPVYKEAGHSTAPTISYHGVEGDKQFVKINMPMQQKRNLDSVHHSRTSSSKQKMPDVHVSTAPGDPEWRPTDKKSSVVNRVTMSVEGVGKIASSDSEQRIAKEYYKIHVNNSQPAPSLASARETTSELKSSAAIQSNLEKLNINIPVMDNASASSAAMYSMSDFDPHCDPEADLPPEDLVPLAVTYTSGAEHLSEMKQRVHDQLEYTQKQNEQFLEAIEAKRSKKRSTIIYSDEESTPRENKDLIIANPNVHSIPHGEIEND